MCKELLHFGLLKLFTFLRAYVLNKRMPDSNKYIHVYTKSRIKTSKLMSRRQNGGVMFVLNWQREIYKRHCLFVDFFYKCLSHDISYASSCIFDDLFNLMSHVIVHNKIINNQLIK